MTEKYVDLRNVAVRYHIDVFRLVNKALKMGLEIKRFGLIENKLEDVVTIEDIPKDDKLALNRFKHDDIKERLESLNRDIQQSERELKTEAEKDEVRERLEVLYSERNSLLKLSHTYSQYNGRE